MLHSKIAADKSLVLKGPFALVRYLPRSLGKPGGAGREIAIGWVLIGVFFGLFLIWSLTARLDAAVHAYGSIVVSGNRQTVQHKDGGIVEAIDVKEGQRVKAGDVLMKLRAVDVAATEQSLISQVAELLSRRSRLLAEREGGAVVSPPVGLADMVGQDSADEALRLQQSELDTRRAALRDQKSLITQRISQLAAQIAGYEKQAAAMNQQTEIVQQQLTSMQSLVAKGLATQTSVRSLQLRLSELDAQREGFVANSAQAREKLGETQLSILSLESQRSQEIATELREIDVYLNDTAPRLTAAKQKLEDLIIRAPTSGQIVGFEISTVGAIIAPGQQLLDIVPDNAILVVEARVVPADANNLAVGQDTEVRFTGLRGRDIPTVTGKLSRLSADSFLDERTGTHYFTAEVSITQDQIDRINTNVAGSGTIIKAGLPAEILVPYRKRTAFEYLTEPLTDALWSGLHEK